MIEKKVSEAINFRRAVRIYDSNKKIDKTIVKKCIEQAILAPNSDNLQLWEFYHITSQKKLKQISYACFNQPAAKTSQQIVIAVVRRKLWKSRAKMNSNFIKKNNPKDLNTKKIIGAINYYEKTIPKVYSDFFGIIGFLKLIKSKIIGFYKPINKQVTYIDKRIAGHKSTALAAQNFMISMSAYGYDTCPMEGFDSDLLKKYLDLPKNSEICMVIGCGIRSENGIYGHRYRVPLNHVYFEK